MLYLIGLGIGSEKDISVMGVEACRKAGDVYAELYTARWPGSISNLESIIGRKITLLERKDLEEKSEEFVKKAEKKDIALFVPGDPLTATTHLNLLMDAKRLKIPFTVVHSSSILTAVAETGLSVYSFGKTVTVARPQESYSPTSFYEAALGNKKAGLHTLLLLDIDMDTGEGLSILLDIEKKKRKGLLKPGSLVVAASALGTEKAVTMYGKAGDLAGRPLKPPAVLIIPGRLQFFEREWLESL